MRLHGDEQVVRDLMALRGRVDRKELLKVLNRAALRVKEEIKRDAPVGPTGNLKRSIQKRTLRGEPPAVQVRSNFKKAPHTHLVVQGTRERFRRRVWIQALGIKVSSEGASTGRMTPNNFIARARQRVAYVARRMIMEDAKKLINR